MKTPKRGFMFTHINVKKPKRNLFNLSYENKFSGNMCELIPFYVQDVLPHDTFKLQYDYLMRTQPMIAPLMHRVDVYQYFFFVPLRLIWDNFEVFITGGDDGAEVPEHPYFKMQDIMNNSAQYNKLFDNLGYPQNQAFVDSSVEHPSNAWTYADQKVSSLRWRAYNLIYNEYFRDQNLEEELEVPKTDGHDTFTSLNGVIQHRSWKRDYFTSSLPFLQKGAQVTLPLGGEAPVTGTIPRTPYDVVDENGNKIEQQEVAQHVNYESYGEGPAGHMWTQGADGLTHMYSPERTFEGSADLSQATSVSINDFRIANVMQKFKELLARGGSRYVEQIRSMFGIVPDDYRLQRPLYLGGNKQPLNISEVVQTSMTDEDTENSTPQANLAGKGTAFGAQFGFKRTFSEHGIIIGLVCVMPNATYQQGCSRLLQKFDKFDYGNPMFANIGEQPVYSREVFMWSHKDSSSTKDLDAYNNKVFGYQSRFAEYKYNFDQVHGDFRKSLSYWHLGRIFDGEVNLNKSFVKSNPEPGKRIFAVTTQDEDSLLFDVYHNCTALRCLSAYGTPSL